MRWIKAAAMTSHREQKTEEVREEETREEDCGADKASGRHYNEFRANISFCKVIRWWRKTNCNNYHSGFIKQFTNHTGFRINK
jgi:hypothetical protein